MASFSQASQDLFVKYLTNKKKDGYFIEIGSNHPITNNNTILLEKKYKWKGLLVEYDGLFEESYKKYRCVSKYIIGDARDIDYRLFLVDNKFPQNIDYLQIDLDVNNGSTIDVLKLFDDTVFDSYKFATITFEHDIYTGDYFNTRIMSRKIFSDNGYILIFPDVATFFEGKKCQFEDWYVHPDLVNMNFVDKIKLNHSENHKTIINRIENIISQNKYDMNIMRDT